MSKLNKNAGFTLLEAVVALFVVSLICLSFSWLVAIGQKLTTKDQLTHELAWHVFLIQLENAAEKWEFQQVAENRLYFIDRLDGDKEIIIEHYRHQIKKAKNRGYEPLLFNVQEMQVQQTEKGVEMEVVFNDNREYQAYFSRWQAKTEND